MITINEKPNLFDGDYVNIWHYFNTKYPLQFFIGGRGTGKTYSALKGMMDYSECPLFLRRTQTEMKLLMDTKLKPAIGNPFKILPNEYKDYCFYGEPNSFGILCKWYTQESVDGRLEVVYDKITRGYASSLRPMLKRGIEIPECDIIVYDEFIKKKNDRKIMDDEFTALFEIYDTIARNREFDGGEPLYLMAMSNSNTIYNDVFKGLGVINSLEKCLRQAKEKETFVVDYYNPEKALAIHILPDSRSFKEKRAQTVVAKATSGTSYGNMALKNEFAYDDFTNVKVMNIRGMHPICHHEDMFIYKKKGSAQYYITYTFAYCTGYKDNSIDNMRFYSNVGHSLMHEYSRGNIYFESYELKMRFLKLTMNI